MTTTVNYDPTPICVKDHREMSCYKNGVFILVKDSHNEPVKIDCADMYKCKECGQITMKGYAPGSVEHWQDEFDLYMTMWNRQEEGFKVWVHA